MAAGYFNKEKQRRFVWYITEYPRSDYNNKSNVKSNGNKQS